MGYWKDTIERWYRPHIDHHVHPDVSLEDFRYYRGLLREFILREKIIRKESFRPLFQYPIFLCQILVEPGLSPLAVLSWA